MTAREIIKIHDLEISYQSFKEKDYISLTDMAKYKNSSDPRFVIQNWMKTRYTVDFLGIWEKMHNNNFNRVEFDTFKTEAGTNAFVLTPQKWIEKTGAIGLVSKAGRYGGGTFAHKDIAFEFATWLSPGFKLYLIKEFERLKSAEYVSGKLEWNARRVISKTNYRIHTNAIKERLPRNLTEKQINFVYASEADVLNMALFGKTANLWREENKGKKGNMREDASILELIVLSNLENLNAEFIRQGLPQNERLRRLNKSAINQLKSLNNNPTVKKLENKA